MESISDVNATIFPKPNNDNKAQKGLIRKLERGQFDILACFSKPPLLRKREEDIVDMKPLKRSQASCSRP